MKALVAALAMTLAATAAPAAELTLERLFASPALSGPAPRAPKLSPDGRFATLLRNRPDDLARYDLWAIDTASGQSRMLVDSLKLGSGAVLSEEEKMRRERARLGGVHGIVGYEWAPDGKSLLVPLDGDLWLAPLDGAPAKLPAPNGALDPQVSAAGGYVSYVESGNLFAIDLHGGRPTRLTPDGGGTVHWGSAEFVAQEEMDRFKGHWWAPGDRFVAVERYDEARVPLVTRAAIGTAGTRTYEQRYPAAGQPNVAVELWIMAPDGSHRVKADLGTDPDIYLARVDWAPDARTLYVQRESRDQHRLDLLAIDPATGGSRVVLTETAKTWINLNDGFHPLAGGDFLWVSERSGFAHLYRGHGGVLTLVTHGSWAIASVIGVDQKAGRAFFLANKDDVVAQQLYSVDYRHPGAPVALGEAGWWNAATMDRAATHALIVRSSPSQPPQVYLADAAGRRIAWIEQNRLDAGHPYAPYLASHVAPVFGTISAADGKTVLHTKLLLPKVAPGTKVPVFVQVYNGPNAGRQVLRQWYGDLPLHEYLVSKGWAVFSVDGRGSPDRGKAFEEPIYHAFGTVEVADQLAGLAWLKAQPWADPQRIAVYGWSYGGYMTLKLLEGAPGAFAAGVSGAPVTRWELYDTHYTERFLGNPTQVPDVYARSGAIDGATKIADPLLMLHGMADDNVFFDNSVAMYGALQHAGTPFEMMAYPGQGHAFAPDVRLQLWRVIERFLDRTVKDRQVGQGHIARY